MSDDKMKKFIRFSEENLELRCEYEDCEVVEIYMETFAAHINDCHLSRLGESDPYCRWRDCDAFTCSKAELRRHLLLHAYHAKIKCHGRNVQLRKDLPDCTLGTQNRNLVPELPDPMMCCWGQCVKSFENPEYFYRHVEAHTLGSEPEKKCLWSGCERTFPDPHKLRDHVRAHSQEKTVACPVCGAMFASRTKYIDHVMRQLPVGESGGAQETFVCEYCSRKLPTERLLRDHMRIHVSHYKCPFCDMTCPTPSNLRQHITYRHCDTKSFSCQYCDYKCKRRGDLRKHLETHSEIASYTCPHEDCDYATRSPTCLNHHVLTKHGEMKRPQYMCHVCSKVTTRGNYLTKHMLSKHNIRWPSGHSRFRYRLDEDGFYRLQTVRYESAELSEAMLQESGDKEDVDDPSAVVDTSPAATTTTTLVQGTPSRVYISPSAELAAGNPSAVPLTLYVENGEGGVSVNTVALEGEVRDLILVTPDGKECGTITVQVVDSVPETTVQ